MSLALPTPLLASWTLLLVVLITAQQAPATADRLHLADGGTCIEIPGVNDRCEAWSAVYDNGNDDVAMSLAASPGGERVFVTGLSKRGTDPFSDQAWDAATVAFDGATGEQLWSRRFGEEGKADGAHAIAVNEEGTRVYVVGLADAEAGYHFVGPSSIMTIAYDAHSGEELWARTLDVTPGIRDFAVDVVVGSSERGDRIYVLGRTWNAGDDIETIAYGHEGDLLWRATYDGPVGGQDRPISIALSPDGQAVFVLGRSEGKPEGGRDSFEFVVAAYDSGVNDDPQVQRGGTLLWVARYNGPADRADIPFGLAVSPNGDSVYVTGFSDSGGELPTPCGRNCVMVTIAYDAASGQERWVSTFDGVSDDEGRVVTVSPDGQTVFAAGVSLRSNGEFVVIAHRASDGAELWAASYAGPVPGSNDVPRGIAVSDDSEQLYVTGESVTPVFVGFPATYVQGDWATVAYDTTSGEQLWVARHNNEVTRTGSWAQPKVHAWRPLSLSPEANRLFVARTFSSPATGTATGGDWHDYGIVAYDL